MSSTVLFGIIHKFHCVISANFLLLSTVLSVKKFQFQQNKRIPVVDIQHCLFLFLLSNSSSTIDNDHVRQAKQFS